MILISENNYNQKGFGIIEVLIGIAIFSIGFMAISSAIWSSSKTSRTAYYSNESILEGNNFIEYTALLPSDSEIIEDNEVSDWGADGYSLNKNGYEIIAKWKIIDEKDTDGDGNPNFRTLDLRIFQKAGSGNNEKLRLKTVYRQEVL